MPSCNTGNTPILTGEISFTTAHGRLRVTTALPVPRESALLAQLSRSKIDSKSHPGSITMHCHRPLPGTWNGCWERVNRSVRRMVCWNKCALAGILVRRFVVQIA